jgi:hypothetical protein
MTARGPRHPDLVTSERDEQPAWPAPRSDSLRLVQVHSGQSEFYRPNR